MSPRRTDLGAHSTPTTGPKVTLNTMTDTLDETIRFYRIRRRRLFDETYVEGMTQEEREEVVGTPLRWVDEELTLLKYIDDFNSVEKCYKDSGEFTYTQNKQALAVNAIKLQKLYQEVEKRAREIGMRVNQKKTQMLCISSTFNSDVTTYVKTGLDERITSTTGLKILGFHFGIKPNASAQVEAIIRKLENLETLNISYNELLYLPQEIGQLKQLKTLNLAYNTIEALPKTINKLCLLYTSPSPRD